MAIFNARAADNTWLVHPEARSFVRDGNYRWLNRSPGGTTIFDIRAGKNKAKRMGALCGYIQSSRRLSRPFTSTEAMLGKRRLALARQSPPDWGQGARVGFNIDDNRPFNGLMDDLNIWKRGLTEEEV